MRLLYRLAQALVLVAVASSFAQADNFMYFKKKAAAGGGCSSPSGHTFDEGWEGPGPGAGWTQSGSTIDNAVNITALTPVASNACTYGFRSNASATNAYAYRDTTITDNTAVADIYFTIYIDNTVSDIDYGGIVTIMQTGNSTNPASLQRFRVHLYNKSSTVQLYQLYIQATTSSAKVDLPSGKSWYYIHAHIEYGTNTSVLYFSTEGHGVSETTVGPVDITGASNPGRYLFIGNIAGLGAGEISDVHYGYIYY